MLIIKTSTPKGKHSLLLLETYPSNKNKQLQNIDKMSMVGAKRLRGNNLNRVPALFTFDIDPSCMFSNNI